ncbi:hypothetical protein [Streptomyces sp. TR02-1]|uniref:hypothetical protein n=1 Tax=Streptomyces sp. TR02-1 TaxID=3385977 RepID=UPI0039A2BE43
MTALPRALCPRGLTWAVLTTHRAAARTWAVFVLALAVGLVALYYLGEYTERVTLPCGGAGSPVCGSGHDDRAIAAISRYTSWSGVASSLLAYMPLGVAAWAGGALVAREVEQDTTALSWTQTTTPTRWLVAKLALPTLALALGSVLLTVLFRWTWVSGDPHVRADWYMDDVYRATGPVGPASALFALLLGVVIGLWVRRTLPALGLGFVGMGIVQLLGARHRADLWPKEFWSGKNHSLAWSHVEPFALEGVVTPSGERIGMEACRVSSGGVNIQRCMEKTGATEVYGFLHPTSHYWPLQWVETGILLAAAGLLTFLAFRLLRRRLP